MAYATVTLTGRYTKPDGTPASGVVEIIPNSDVIVDAAGNVIVAGRVKVDLTAQGTFAVALPATDAAGLEPATLRQYAVSVKLHHTNSVPTIQGLTLTGTGTYDMADLTSGVVADPVFSSWFTEADKDALYARVDALEARPIGGGTWDSITGKPTTFPPATHNHDDRYYTETEADTRFQPAGNYQPAGSYATAAQGTKADTALQPTDVTDATAADIPYTPGGTVAATTVQAAIAETAADALQVAVIDAKGDLIAGTADNTAARVPVGTTGQILTADPAATPGIKWADPPTGGGTTYTDEQAQDATGALFTNGVFSGMTFTYNDAANRMEGAVTASGGGSFDSISGGDFTTTFTPADSINGGTL